MSQVDNTGGVNFTLPTLPFIHCFVFLLSQVLRFRLGWETEAVVLYLHLPGHSLWLVLEDLKHRRLLTTHNLMTLNDSLTHSTEKLLTRILHKKPVSSICPANLPPRDLSTPYKDPFSPLNMTRGPHQTPDLPLPGVLPL